MSRRYLTIAVMAVLALTAALLNVGCTGGSGSQEVESVDTAVEWAEPTRLPTVAPTPSPSPMRVLGETQGTGTTPAPTNTPEPTPPPSVPPTQRPRPTATPVSSWSSDDIYAEVAPSIAMIVSSIGWGSGVLIEGGYLVTNHHVVWPDRQVRVLLPDGSDYRSVPVVAVDPLADVALLGPVATTARGLAFRRSEYVPVGSEVFLLGYPGEVDLDPVPTIVSGVLSRLRRWGQGGITYLQTDAAIAGGQSGGALVDAKGRLIGISGFSFSEARYALVASGIDVARVVGRLKRGADTPALGDRVFPEGRGKLEFAVALEDRWDRRDFVLTASDDTTVEFELACEGDADMRLYDGAGNLVQESRQDGDVESLDPALPGWGVYFLQVAQGDGDLARCRLYSSIELRQLPDPDDGRSVVRGRVIAGSLDHFRDVDWYSIDLEAGEMIDVSTDSLNVDTILYVRCQTCGEDEIAHDDDGGGGLFGMNSRVIYRAAFDGEHLISVNAVDSENAGGYYLSVKRALPGSALTPLSGESKAASVREAEKLANQAFHCFATNEDARESLVSSVEERLVAEGMNEDLVRGILELLLKDAATFASAMTDRIAEDPSIWVEFLDTWCKEDDLRVEGSGSDVGPLFREAFGDGRVSGPLSGSLAHNPFDGKIKRKPADVRLDDFLVAATFLNPYPVTRSSWDYGFFLRDDRDLATGRFGYLVVTSEGNWSLRWRNRATGETTVVSRGRLDGLDISARGRNVLEMAIFGESGLFFVNGEFVAVLDLSDMPVSGDVAVVTGVFKNNEARDAVTRFRNFEIWSLDKVHDSVDGGMVVGPDGSARYSSDAVALDFVAEAEFVKPSGDDWLQGLVVRGAVPDRFDSVAVNGGNLWAHVSQVEGEEIETSGGFVPGGPEDRIHLLLVGFGSVGFFFLDGELMSRLDLSGNLEPGVISLVGGTHDEDVSEMRFENFRVWVQD